MSRWILAAAVLAACGAIARAADLPPDARMSWLENAEIKVGVDLNRGGAIVYLSREGGANLVNNFDRGRQVQLSFYSGPVPFSAAGQHPKKHWEHLGWNPVQAGDDFGNVPEVTAHENDGRSLHVRCRPLQWPLNRVAADCFFDSWIELDGVTVKVRARLENARGDATVYPARLQELPAAYANGSFFRVVSFTGTRPFAGGAVTEITKSQGSHPWSFWTATEHWSALLDAKDNGLGLITPCRMRFTGGFNGQPGESDTLGNAAGYLAGQSLEILDPGIGFEFQYELVAGSLREIRERAAKHRPVGLPGWVFATDRQHWHHQNASDAGWPMKDHWEIRLDRDDPQLFCPHTLWQAEAAPRLMIEAAFRTSQRSATVYWQPLDHGSFAADTRIEFPIEGDGKFRVYEIDLSRSPAYRGALTRLRIDPVPAGEAGAWMKVKSIRLAR
jgi:hypothetical protein